jgi:2-methylcitrate dehydratase PrpD
MLLGLDRDRLTYALGIAGTMAAGSLEYVSDGSWTKRLNAGWAAHSGVVAAQLAAAGFTGPASVFEGRLGALHSFTDSPSPDRLLDGLGDEPLLMTVAIKPYACCRYNHGLIDAVLAIRDAEQVSERDVARVRLGVLTAGAVLVADPIEQKRLPMSTVDAQFSAPYAAAVALLHGRAGIDQFSESAVRDERLRGLMAVTDCYTSPELDGAYPQRWPAQAEITLTDGRVIERWIEYALGEPENWIPRAALLEKFADLSSGLRDSMSLADWILDAKADTPIAEFTQRIVES